MYYVCLPVLSLLTCTLAVVPPSALRLVIIASLSAGIPLFCIGLVFASCFILLCQRYIRIKQQSTAHNPLYDTAYLPNTLSFDGKEAAPEEKAYAIKSENFTSVF